MKLILCLLVTAIILSYLDLCSGGWGYIDQEGWSKLHDSSCGGMKQSPIDLPDVCKKGSGTIVNPRMNLELINYDSDVPASVMTLKNNGHTAVISFRDSKTPNAWTPKISGSALYGESFPLLYASLSFLLQTKDQSSNYYKCTSIGTRERLMSAQSMVCMDIDWLLR